MRRFVDLHTHSTASDGTYSPSEIIRAAEQESLAAIALTDHDTVDGIEEAALEAEKYSVLRFIPGVELSVVNPLYTTGALHVLGLGIDVSSEELQRTLQESRDAREKRNPKILSLLQGSGIDICMEDVMEFVLDSESAKRVVSRVHIAKALVARKKAFNVPDAFRKYLTTGALAWVEKEKLKAEDAIKIIRNAGGVAVIAHPALLQCRNSAIRERLLRQWIDAGLSGIECYHSSHSTEEVRQYIDLAKSFGLFITGGSDFHGGDGGTHASKVGRPRVPVAGVQRFLAAL